MKSINLGLGLQGGFEVLYNVEPAQEGQEITKEDLKNTVAALRQRIDILGVNEPNIDIEGSQNIRVQLAGVTNQEQARKLLSTQANLEFRSVKDKLLMDGSALVPGEAKVTFQKNNPNQPIVSIQLKSADKFGEVTHHIVKKFKGKKMLGVKSNRLVIWMDYDKGESYKEELKKSLKNPAYETKYISAPIVDQTLRTSEVVIEGDFTMEEAQRLASLLNAGSLPVKLTELSSKSVGAQFGKNSLQKTVTAGIVGIAIIMLFMIAYYRMPGVIAVVTLFAYMYLVLLIYEWMGATLTLSGIAAFVLGIGMAVDANVITYERIKEEIRSGKSILSSFKAGNRVSFVTILDANLTTIIAAGVLFAFGTSSVKGFAVMLIISILCSFATAVYGSRFMLGLWVKSRVLDKRPRMFGVKESDIDEL